MFQLETILETLLEPIIETSFIIGPFIALGLILVLLFRLIRKEGYRLLSKQILIPILSLSLLYVLLYFLALEIFFYALVILIYLVLVGGTIIKIRDKAYGWALMWLSVFIFLSAYYLIMRSLARAEVLIPLYFLLATISFLLLYGIIKQIKNNSYGWAITWIIIFVLLGSYFLSSILPSVSSGIAVIMLKVL